MILHLMLASLVLVSSCFRNPEEGAHLSSQDAAEIPPSSKPCQLVDGAYPIQELTFNKTKASYHVIILNAPACMKQPLTLPQLPLGRLEASDQEKAKLTVVNQSPEKILIAPDFKMNVVESIVKNGVESTTEPSPWSPLLSGAAGAVIGGAVGGAIANKMMERRATPQPPSQIESANSPSQSFNRTEPSSPTTTYQKGQRNTRTKGSFFKKKRR